MKQFYHLIFAVTILTFVASKFCMFQIQGGIVYSNKVTTVSPIYAADLLTEQFGYDMHVTLNTHKYVQFLILIVRTGEM